MKMSEKNYKKFKKWYDYTVENANDATIELIFELLAGVAKQITEMKKELN